MDASVWVGFLVLGYASFRDIVTMRVPIWLLYGGVVGVAVQRTVQGHMSLEWVVGVVGGYLLIRSVIWITRGAMGRGDAPAFALICACEGWRDAAVAFGTACCLASVAALLMMLMRWIGRSDPIPFVPFLLAGGILSYLWGPLISSHLLLP